MSEAQNIHKIKTQYSLILHAEAKLSFAPPKQNIKHRNEAEFRKICDAKNTLRYKIVNKKQTSKKGSKTFLIEKITWKNNLTKIDI